MNRQKDITRPISGRAFLKRRPLTLPNLSAQLIFWPLMLSGLTLDLWSKKAVFDWLEQKQAGSFSIIEGLLQLVAAVNDGAAFGIAAGQRHLLVMVSVTALIVVFVVFLFGGAKKRLMHVALGLFAAGICGNLCDRIFNDGLVRDFIDVYYRRYHWPAFNAADSMLCVAVGLMIISSFFIKKPSQKCAQQHK